MKGNEVESQGNQNASIRKLWGRSELPSSRAAGLIGPDCGIRTLPFRRVTVWFSKLCWVLQSKRKGEYLSNIPTLQINHTVPVCNKRQAKVTTSREGQIDNTEMQTAHKCTTKGHFSPPQGGETKISCQSTITTQTEAWANGAAGSALPHLNTRKTVRERKLIWLCQLGCQWISLRQTLYISCTSVLHPIFYPILCNCKSNGLPVLHSSWSANHIQLSVCHLQPIYSSDHVQERLGI